MTWRTSTGARPPLPYRALSPNNPLPCGSHRQGKESECGGGPRRHSPSSHVVLGSRRLPHHHVNTLVGQRAIKLRVHGAQILSVSKKEKILDSKLQITGSKTPTGCHHTTENLQSRRDKQCISAVLPREFVCGEEKTKMCCIFFYMESLRACSNLVHLTFCHL